MPPARRRRRATLLSVFALLLTVVAPPSAADAARSLEHPSSATPESPLGQARASTARASSSEAPWASTAPESRFGRPRASAAPASPFARPWASGTLAIDQPGEPGLPLWQWPVDGGRSVLAAYRAPAHAYGAGHRGIDVAASPGGEVHAPADGIVAFSGTVVDRPLVTIRHDDGLVSTLEPVSSALLPGGAVHRGQPVGALASGGHTPPGALHLGVRLNGAYINPLLLYGGAPRAVLLPCCDG